LHELIRFQKLFSNPPSNQHWKYIAKDTEKFMFYDSLKKSIISFSYRSI